jgi:hypothetical protein
MAEPGQEGKKSHRLESQSHRDRKRTTERDAQEEFQMKIWISTQHKAQSWEERNQ